MVEEVSMGSGAPSWLDERIGPDGLARFRARVGGLHCSLCTGTLEKALGRKPGVTRVAVSLTHEQALVEYDPGRVDAQDLIDTLRDIGYSARDPAKVRPYEEEEAELVRDGRRLLVGIALSLQTISVLMSVAGLWYVCAAVGLSFLVVAYLLLRPRGVGPAVAGTAGLAALTAVTLALEVTGVIEPAVPWIVASFALAMVFGLARHILVVSVQSIRRGILNQHVMLEAAAFAGLAGGAIGLALRPEDHPTGPFFGVAVLVTTYHLFSEWLSLLVKTRSSQAVKRLLELQPDVARVLRDGGEREVPITEVVVGDLVRIRPGERVPVDGVVTGGHSAVDHSLVTGEPVPVERAPGDPVVGGSVNGSGTLLVEVSAVGEESFLARVVRHVEDARALKPGILHLVDRVLRIYAPAVLLVSAAALVAWSVGSWVLGGGVDVERATFAALSVLVMGYPCAVGIAAPLSIVRGAGEAADEGVIMRTGEAFQALRLVRTVVLDKTGTLTEGRPTVREVEAAGGDPDELLALVAAAESSSEHPLASAVLTAAAERGLDVPGVDSFDSVAGQGVVATIGGRRVLVGRLTFVEAGGVDVAGAAPRVAELEAAGRTVVAAGRDRALLGVIAFDDRLRPDAAEAVAAMRGAGMRPVLMTGDNPRVAEAVGKELGIDEVHAGVLPDEKAGVVRALQGGGRVAMVGDGINDAPSLMQADVGVAMGGGTDIAIESADVVIVGNRLGAVVTARDISRHSYRKTKQNVALAFVFNGIGIPAAATGLVYPVWAMVAMAISVSSIFINSLWGRPGLFFNAILSVGRGASRPEPAMGLREAPT
ncbi:MAG TPA: cation-translocating P-type ATPase [Acidimicrobiales bacterium]|nr:cation-translocating P-type ATPase [Acidimicrobiales bacterium]